MSVVAVRGAITVPANTAVAIREATARLLRALVEANELTTDRIVSAIFTATPDLDADFPAHAARLLGWTEVPLLGAREMAVPGALERVVRVLLTVRESRVGERLTPIYLEGAAALRPDLTGAGLGEEGRVSTSARPAPLPSSPDSSAENRVVALIGLGQIGGSIGLALSGHPWRRVGYDLDPAAAAAALEADAIDAIAASLAEACGEAAMAVLAAPVDELPRLIEEVAGLLPRGAALIDTGSTRRALVPALERAAGRGVTAVGGHPLAGTAGRGFHAAHADLFRGAHFVLLPVAGAPPEIVLDLVRDLGAVPLLSDPERHDAALARTSHLPYLVARAVQEAGEGAARSGLSGPTFRDMTRVAGSDPRMALAYCRANADEIRAAWRELRQALDRAVDSLES